MQGLVHMPLKFNNTVATSETLFPLRDLNVSPWFRLWASQRFQPVQAWSFFARVCSFNVQRTEWKVLSHNFNPCRGAISLGGQCRRKLHPPESSCPQQVALTSPASSLQGHRWHRRSEVGYFRLMSPSIRVVTFCISYTSQCPSLYLLSLSLLRKLQPSPPHFIDYIWHIIDFSFDKPVT